MKSKLFVVLFFFINMSFICNLLYGQTLPERPSNYYDQDAGSAENPFLIANLANLRWLTTADYYWGDVNQHGERVGFHFLQTADIDAEESKEWNFGHGAGTIGYVSGVLMPFRGLYDGNGFIISNLYQGYLEMETYLNSYSTSALFGYTVGAVIKNVRLENIVINIVADRPINAFGGLIGLAGNTSVFNCYVTGNIFITKMIPAYSFSLGGLVGVLSNSTIENSYFNGNIVIDAVETTYGALIGAAFNSIIDNCYVASSQPFENINALIGRIGVNPNTQNFTSIKNILWDKEATGVLKFANEVLDDDATLENNYGLTTSEMKTKSTYVNNSWDFVNIWQIDSDINNGYPFIQSAPPPKDLKGTIEKNTYTVILEWEKPFLFPAGYNVYRDEKLLTTMPIEETIFFDYEVPVGEHIYSVHAVYSSWISNSTSVIVKVDPVSEVDKVDLLRTEIIGNFPNPFNPETTILFSLEKTGIVIFEVFNIRGQKVKTLINESINAGHHQVIWNGTDDFGRNVSSGTYFYRINAGSESLTRRMLLLK